MKQELKVLQAGEEDLEQKIENSLIKENITDKVIQSLKDNYGGMKLKSIDDKESYLDIVAAKREVRKVGIATEKICKYGREDALKIQKLWLSKEKEILAKIDEVQLPLEAEIKKFDDEVARKENEEKKRMESVFQQRQATLIKYGAKYNNGSFELNHISYEIDNIRDADEEIWNDIILPKYKKEFERVESERVAEENRKAEEIRILKEQQEELRKEKEEFENQKREVEKDKLLIQQRKDEEERDRRAKENEKQEALLKEKREKISNRWEQLTSIGMRFNSNFDAYTFEDINIDNKTEISLLDDTEWTALLNKVTPIVKERKKEIEDAEIQRRITEQKRLDDIKAEQEKQRNIEDMAKAGDKEKWLILVNVLNGIEFPEMKSPLYKKKVSILKEKLEEVKEL